MAVSAGVSYIALASTSTSSACLSSLARSFASSLASSRLARADSRGKHNPFSTRPSLDRTRSDKGRSAIATPSIQHAIVSTPSSRGQVRASARRRVSSHVRPIKRVAARRLNILPLSSADSRDTEGDTRIGGRARERASLRFHPPRITFFLSLLSFPAPRKPTLSFLTRIGTSVDR